MTYSMIDSMMHHHKPFEHCEWDNSTNITAIGDEAYCNYCAKKAIRDATSFDKYILHCDCESAQEEKRLNKALIELRNFKSKDINKIEYEYERKILDMRYGVTIVEKE